MLMTQVYMTIICISRLKYFERYWLGTVLCTFRSQGANSEKHLGTQWHNGSHLCE